MNEKTKIIAELNDKCRQTLLLPMGIGDAICKVYATKGITNMPLKDQTIIAAKVMYFDDFTEDNNSSGERDFGTFSHNGEEIFWKINCYDKSMTKGSEDPSDPEQTKRVLTVMLVSEY